MITELSGIEALTQPVTERAQRAPRQRCLVFVHEDGSEQAVSASEFHLGAMHYAQALRASGVHADDLVILVLRHSPELLSAFWGALYLGAIPAIFPFLTEKLDPALYMERVRTLVAHSGARAVVTFPEFKRDLENLLVDVACRVLSTDEVLSRGTTTGSAPNFRKQSSEKIAFLQHSSGTTGLQKGVALSHRAVLNQVRAYSRAIEVGPSDVVVSWLPLYHDMGLIAGFIMPLILGIPLVLLSPFHWVRDPKILLWAIHEHRGTLCWLPNFAYNHCVRSIRARDLNGLDLSCWRAAINCSEPVRYDSHQIFVERFGPYGFGADALASCYAMAENVFAVTQSRIGEQPHTDWVDLRALQEQRRAVPIAPGAHGATPVISCGETIEGTAVAVVDEPGELLPDRHVGEIILHGNSMLTEIYRRPDLTAQAMRGGWYYTGDMGYLADGQLYISGRKKDLIIVGGKNIYPQDLEAIANDVPGIHPGRAVAFGVMNEKLGSEGIVMVCERDSTRQDQDPIRIESRLRQRIVQHMDIALEDVRLVEQRWLIKTSSGKIARAENRSKYLHAFRGIGQAGELPGREHLPGPATPATGNRDSLQRVA
jgi:fatty-acyl-CoA synthase